LRNLARGWFRVSREQEPVKWPEALARLATGYVREGLDEQSVRAALAAVWRHLAPALPESEFARMMELVGKVSAEERRPRRLRWQDGIARVAEPTPLEEFGARLAVEHLRMALARQDPVVKRCVALRLLRHLSCEKLAGELELTLDEVKLILERMRPWVKRFTTYFERDWYWQDGARRFTLPDGV